MASFGNFGNIMSGPSYLDQRRYLDKRADDIGASFGTIAGGLTSAWDKEKAQKIRDDYSKARRLQHAADDFEFDADAYRKQLEEQRLAMEPQGTMEPEPLEQSVEDPFGLDTDYAQLDIGLRDSLGMGQEQSIEDPNFIGLPTEQSIEISDDEINSERERQLNALFGEDISREEYERLRNIYKPGMKQSEEYYRLGTLLRPYDNDAADKLEDKAFQQSQFEAKLLDDQTRAAEKAKIAAAKNEFIRMEEAYGSSRSRTNQLTQQYAQQLSSNQPDAARLTKMEMEKWNSQGDKQYARLNEMDPKRYPNFDVAPEVTPEELGGDNTNSDHTRLTKLANEAVQSNGEIDPSKFIGLPENEQRIALDMAQKVSQIKAGNIKLRQEQAQGNIETSIKSEDLKSKQRGSGTERDALKFYNQTLAAERKLNDAGPINVAELAQFTGTGIGILDTLNKLRSTKGSSRALINALNWVSPGLRDESGAAIAEMETGAFIKRFIPISTDTPDIIADKLEQRTILINGLKSQAGQALEYQQGKKKKKKSVKQKKTKPTKSLRYNPKTRKFE